MKPIRDIFAARKPDGRPVVSFEFFPPKTPDGDLALFQKTLPALQQLNPSFCSVTYGAGGSTRNKTLSIAHRIQRDFGIPAMAHLTCVNATRDEIASVVDEAASLGIQNILALRGDPPAGTGGFRKTENGFEFACELIAFLRRRGGFSIGTAGFPEGHIACTEGKHVDWDRLKAKIDHGADFILTQLFFDNADFFEFRDYLDKIGVHVPISPGILPILSTAQIKRFTALCGARLPDPLAVKLDALRQNDDAVRQFGVEFASRQCADLLQHGVQGLHFYTLNRAQSTTEILHNLSLDR